MRNRRSRDHRGIRFRNPSAVTCRGPYAIIIHDVEFAPAILLGHERDFRSCDALLAGIAKHQFIGQSMRHLSKHRGGADVASVRHDIPASAIVDIAIEQAHPLPSPIPFPTPGPRYLARTPAEPIACRRHPFPTCRLIRMPNFGRSATEKISERRRSARRTSAAFSPLVS